MIYAKMKPEIKTMSSDYCKKIIINNDKPVINFDSISLKEDNQNIDFNIDYDDENKYITVKKNLNQNEKIIGLGEKAYDILKNRHNFTMYNSDPGGYRRYDDPLYTSIPFLISISENIKGIFINSTSRVDIDIGITEYDKLIIKIYNKSAELYIFDSDNFDSLYQNYTNLTGKTFVPPLWAIEHQISRYSYYPEDEIYDIIDNYKKYTDVSVIYLDIHYMDKFKIFTFDKNKFPDNERLLNNLHKRGIKLVTIMDPGIKLDQNYEIFKNGLGNYIENSNGEIYTSKLWPGNCAMPDFFNEKAYNWWKSEIKNFIKNTDGLWLDMNEPSLFNEFKTIDPEALHNINGNKVKHKHLHNAYAYFEAKATYEAMKEVKNDVFIVSRSGYAGIQKYAAIWTGDNTSSEDDLKLQISMAVSLNLSGVSICGCDLGGFTGQSSPELITKYYKMALLFPFYRNHKDKFSNDQELYKLPELYRNEIINSIKKRYELIDYIYSVIYESHLYGYPVIKPLFYYDINDIDAYYINDEYILGNLLYAPQIYGNNRELYIPAGKWLNINDFSIISGNKYITSDAKYPLYLKNNSMLIINNKLIVFGKSKLIIYRDNKEIRIESDGKNIRSNYTLNYDIIFC